MWAIIRFLLSSAAVQTVVSRVLLTLGFGFISYAGFNELLTIASERVQNYFGGFSNDVIHLLGLAGVDYIVNAFFAAAAANVAMSVTRRLTSR